MTFLNPLALLGLLAAAIPILLHLLNLRKLRTIEFSTLTFLRELEKTKIRRLKIVVRLPRKAETRRVPVERSLPRSPIRQTNQDPTRYRIPRPKMIREI